MVQVLTGIKDEASNLFWGIEVHATTAAAIRNFSMIVQDEKAKMVQKNAKDYNLYFLGNYDNETGKIVGRENPEKIASAEEFITEDK